MCPRALKSIQLFFDPLIEAQVMVCFFLKMVHIGYSKIRLFAKISLTAKLCMDVGLETPKNFNCIRFFWASLLKIVLRSLM
jgi:hypothetical protein